MATMLEYALQYAELGYHVFPVLTDGDNAKRPATPHGHNDATTDADQIREWFADSRYGIGCAAGRSGLTVFDLDPGSSEWIAENPELHQQLTSYPTVRTPRGGVHYYTLGTHAATAPGAVAKNVDIKSDGGYVILPPTTFENGGYTWASVDDLMPVDQIAPITRELSHVVERAVRAKRDIPRLSDGKPLVEGMRDAGLYCLCLDLIRAGIKDSEIDAVALELNRTRCVPPLPEHHVRAKVQSALRSETAKIARVDFSALTLDQFIRMDLVDPEPVPWLWPGRFAIGAVHLIVGMPGCGKSTFLCWLAAAITAGKSLPDGKVMQRHGSVLYLTSEDSLNWTLSPRLDAAGADRSKVFAVEKPLSFPRDLHQLQRLCNDEEIVAIFVDPITSYLSGEHNDNQQVREGLDAMGHFARENQLTWILVSHNSKAKTAGMYAALGAVAFSAFSRGVHTFHKKDDDWQMSDVKNSLAPTAMDLPYRLRENKLEWMVADISGLLETTSEFNPQFASDLSGRDVVLKLVERQEQATNQEIEAELERHNKAASTASNIVGKLITDGLIERVGRGVVKSKQVNVNRWEDSF